MVYRVTSPDATPSSSRSPGPLGKPNRFEVGLAGRVGQRDRRGGGHRRPDHAAAGIDDHRRADRAEDRATDLLRPQFTRYGEVWAIGRQGRAAAALAVQPRSSTGGGRAGAARRRQSRRSGSRRTARGWPWSARPPAGPRSVWPGSSGADKSIAVDGLAGDRHHPARRARAQADRRPGLARHQRPAAAGRGGRGCAARRSARRRRRVAGHGRGRRAGQLGGPPADRPQPAADRRRRRSPEPDLAGHRQRVASLPPRASRPSPTPADLRGHRRGAVHRSGRRPRHRRARCPDSSGELVHGLPLGRRRR